MVSFTHTSPPLLDGRHFRVKSAPKRVARLSGTYGLWPSAVEPPNKRDPSDVSSKKFSSRATYTKSSNPSVFPLLLISALANVEERKEDFVLVDIMSTSTMEYQGNGKRTDHSIPAPLKAS